MARIKYNKVRSGKQIGRGGPRDVQMRQQIRYHEAVRGEADPDELAPKIGTKKQVEEGPREVDLSNYMPLTEVKKKIEEAVEYTREEARKRYESGLRNINNQLKEAKKKASVFDETVINKNAEIKKLQSQLTESQNNGSKELKQQVEDRSIEIKKLKIKLDEAHHLYNEIKDSVNKKELELTKLSTELESKQSLIESMESNLKDLRNQVDKKEEIYERLQSKMDKLYQKISDGTITSFIGQDKPALEDKIFIDPLESGKEPKLDSHIEVKEEKSKDASSDRNMKSDLAKLKNLLKLK